MTPGSRDHSAAVLRSGHLAGAALDWAELLGCYVWARAHGRDPWAA